MIYVSPRHDFEEEVKVTVKIQIDNSLDLGWKKDDIILVTNFDYKYKDIKSLAVSDNAYCGYFPRCSKWFAIIELFERNLIKKEELYWYHDFDTFQLEVINESEIPDDADMALCDYGRAPMWYAGSIFFRKKAQDIFKKTKEIMDMYEVRGDGVEVDERALYVLTCENEEINKRVKKLNNTYNFHSRNVDSNYAAAQKPLKAVHFHPLKEDVYMGIKKPFTFFKGANKISQPFITERIVRIFNQHGIYE